MVRNRTGTIESGGGGDAVTIGYGGDAHSGRSPWRGRLYNGLPLTFRAAMGLRPTSERSIGMLCWQSSTDRNRGVEQDIVSFSKPSIFEPRLLYGLLPDGQIVYSDSSAYALSIASAEQGDILRTITRPFRSSLLRVSKRSIRGEKKHETRRVKSGLAAGFEPRSRFGARVWVRIQHSMLGMEEDDKTFYNEIPVVLQTTWEGRIWVQRRAEEFFEDGPIDVLAADGEYVGTYRAGATVCRMHLVPMV